MPSVLQVIISLGETGSTGGAKEGRGGKGAPPLGKEDKEKKQTTRAERRAQQEQQRAAKAADKAAHDKAARVSACFHSADLHNCQWIDEGRGCFCALLISLVIPHALKKKKKKITQ